MRRFAALLFLVAGLAVGCKPPVVSISETPVQYTDARNGHGKPASTGNIVTIAYRVLLPDGAEVLHDNEFTFELGRGAVIAGFDEAIPGMRAGGRRVVECPPHKHWGRIGYGPIPPNTTLTLEIDLKSVN